MNGLALSLIPSISSNEPFLIKAFDFLRIANSVPNKGKSSIPPLFNGAELLSSTSDKAKFFAETFSDNSKS